MQNLSNILMKYILLINRLEKEKKNQFNTESGNAIIMHVQII